MVAGFVSVSCSYRVRPRRLHRVQHRVSYWIIFLPFRHAHVLLYVIRINVLLDNQWATEAAKHLVIIMLPPPCITVLMMFLFLSIKSYSTCVTHVWNISTTGFRSPVRDEEWRFLDDDDSHMKPFLTLLLPEVRNVCSSLDLVIGYFVTLRPLLRRLSCYSSPFFCSSSPFWKCWL